MQVRYTTVTALLFLGFHITDLSCAIQEVCYGKYGCFSYAAPFDNENVKLPESPSSIGTTFKLYTRHNRQVAQVIDDNNEEKLKKSNFDITKRTVLIIHGLSGESLNIWGNRMRDALLDRENCNVVFAEWFQGSKLPYSQAAGNTRLVGVQTAELISFMISSYSSSPNWAERFYIVGFSLGAQAAGYAGRHLRDNNLALGRITGLDPAGPFFSYTDPAVRLDPTDAEYVDIIHTDANDLVGTTEIVGHIDFLPNGGTSQPGCSTEPGILGPLTCDHFRAPEYYIASIQNRCSWKAYPCSKYLYFLFGWCNHCDGECPSLGYDADQTRKTGTHFLYTNSEAPFCGLS